MTNKEIAARFKLLAHLMELHEESPFKIRTYQSAVRIIEKFAVDFKEMTGEQIREIPGIGAAVSSKMLELLETGHINVLDGWMEKTPPGIIEMLSVKGLGPKKIMVIWRELGIENLGELLYACEENRLMLLKGFGQKTQENIKEAILFFQDQAGQFLYAQAEPLALELDLALLGAIPQEAPGATLKMSGPVPRQLPVIEHLEWVTTLDQQQLRHIFNRSEMLRLYPAPEFKLLEEETGRKVMEVKSGKLPALHFILLSKSDPFEKTLFFQNCSPAFKQAFKEKFSEKQASVNWHSGELFKSLGLRFIPVPQREFPEIIQKAQTSADEFPPVITLPDIKGIIHCHSRYSDGGQTLKEMAIAARDKGFEYLVISDHSKSAGYAGGLQPERILEQHEEIEELNKSLAPFKIFKSIESDILRHGELDYPEEILKRFDLVIASVHSVLKMDRTDATSRLIKAIENPYTHILGHMTGRLLLSRKGYPLDMEKVLDACQANNVVIELNANPRRLDIDWTYIHRALEKGIMLSIDPDAHSIRGMDDIRYGVLVAQKAGLTARQNLSSFDLDTMQQYIDKLKIK